MALAFASGGGGGGAAPGLVKLFDQTLGTAAATIDTGAAGIAAGHGSLIIHMLTQTAEAVAASIVNIRVNNDSGANYDTQVWYANNATLQLTSRLAQTQWQSFSHGASGSSNYSAAAVVTIPDYDNTTFWKSGVSQFALTDATAASNFAGHWAFGWRSTTAISRLAITVASGANLAAGSRLTIYGTQ